MMCNQCKQNKAHVHFEGVINGKTTKLDLCQTCAQKSGLNFGSLGFDLPKMSVSLGELLNALSHLTEEAKGGGVGTSCPQCQWNISDFRRTGKLGCSECYKHFESHLTDIIKRIQGHTLHKGKRSELIAGKPTPSPVNQNLSNLQYELEKAVKVENYELAAQLRDKIRQLEKKRPRGKT